MEIFIYTSKRSVKGKMINQLFDYVELPVKPEILYVEEIGERELIRKGIHSLPSILIRNGENKVILSGNITPKQLQDAIEAVK